MPDLFHIVLGCVLIAVSAANARMLFTRLGRRRRTRIRKVMSAPAGFPVRSALLTAALGAWNLTGAWPAVAVMVAIITWEASVQGAAVVRRARHGRASRAS
jgi:hypothetical protein